MSGDPAITSKLRDALAHGVSDEESRRGRRALLQSTLGGLVGLAAFVAVVSLIDGGRVNWHFPAAFAAFSVVMAAIRYRQLAPQPPEHPGHAELAAMARLYAQCPSCGTLLGRYAFGCAGCGALRSPRVAAVAVALLALGTVLVLVAIWVKTGRS